MTDPLLVRRYDAKVTPLLAYPDVRHYRKAGYLVVKKTRRNLYCWLRNNGYVLVSNPHQNHFALKAIPGRYIRSNFMYASGNTDSYRSRIEQTQTYTIVIDELDKRPDKIRELFSTSIFRNCHDLISDFIDYNIPKKEPSISELLRQLPTPIDDDNKKALG